LTGFDWLASGGGLNGGVANHGSRDEGFGFGVHGREKMVEFARICSNSVECRRVKFKLGGKQHKDALFIAFAGRPSDFGTLNHAPNLTEPTWTNTVHATKIVGMSAANL